MAIITDFMAVPTGQDMTLVGTLVDDAGVVITDDISSWTFICEIRASWNAVATIYSNTSPSINNTTKKVTFTIAKADTQDVLEGTKYWHIRRTGTGVEKSLGYGRIYFGHDPAAGKVN